MVQHFFNPIQFQLVSAFGSQNDIFESYLTLHVSVLKFMKAVKWQRKNVLFNLTNENDY